MLYKQLICNDLNTKMGLHNNWFILLQGAQLLTPSSPLCEVVCSDGSTYTITCGVRAQLIEVNENLLKSPDLMTKKVFYILLTSH
jgi:hypothetical protein